MHPMDWLLIQNKFKEQDDLLLTAHFYNKIGKKVQISVPIQITKTFWQKYGVYLSIVAFFVFVGLLKTFITRREEKRMRNNESRSSSAA